MKKGNEGITEKKGYKVFSKITRKTRVSQYRCQWTPAQLIDYKCNELTP